MRHHSSVKYRRPLHLPSTLRLPRVLEHPNPRDQVINLRLAERDHLAVPLGDRRVLLQQDAVVLEHPLDDLGVGREGVRRVGAEEVGDGVGDLGIDGEIGVVGGGGAEGVDVGVGVRERAGG